MIRQHMRLTAGLAAALLLPAAPHHAATEGTIEKSWRSWTETIDHIVDTTPGETLTLDTEQGSIEIETWNKRQIRVHIERTSEADTEKEARHDFAAHPVEIEQTAGGVTVTARSRGQNSGSIGASTRITVPSTFNVDVRTGGGSISVDDLRGNVTGRTGGGGIRIGRIQGGSVDVRTDGGGIRIKSIQGGSGRAVTAGGGINVGDVTGDLEVRTSGGGIDVGKVTGELIVDTAGGGIGIRGSGGPVSVNTGGGGIKIVGSGGAVAARTGGGGISISDAGGKVVAETGGGGVDIEGAAGPVEASTGGGGINIEGAGGYIEASTGGGDIEAEMVTADTALDTHCEISTGGGDITLVIPGNLKATVDAEVRLKRPRQDYAIDSDFDLKLEGSPSSDRLTAAGDINGGGDLIRLRTTNGDIRIERR